MCGYKTIDGVKYEQELLDMADKFAKVGTLGLPEAEALWKSALDGRGVTVTESKSLEYIIQHHSLSNEAKDYLSRQLRGDEKGKRKGHAKGEGRGDGPAHKKPNSGWDYYEKIEGVPYKRKLLHLAETCAQDGVISLDEASRLWEDAKDGGRVTDIERDTLKYLMKKYAFDMPARLFMSERLNLDAAAAMHGDAKLSCLGHGPAAPGDTSSSSLPGVGLAEEDSFRPLFFNPGNACVQEFLQTLGTASKSLDVAVYVLTDDRLADILLLKHASGVKVRVIADNDQEHKFATSDLAKLRAAGIEVRLDRTPAHMHHKVAIIDGTTCICGSANWTTGALKNNRENSVIITCKSVVDRFVAEFDRLWNEFASDEPLSSSGVAPDAEFKDGCAVLCFPDRHDFNLKMLLHEVQSAKSSLDVAMFTLTLPEMIAALIHARERGLRVRVITDDVQAKIIASMGKRIAELRSAGIEVRDDHSPANMHHKFCIIDDETLCNGSFNWTRQASDRNNENVIIFRKAPRLALSFKAEFEKLWAAFA